MTGGRARAAVGLRLKLDLVFPIAVGNDLGDVSGTLAGVHRMARPARPPFARLADVDIVEIQVAVAKLGQAPAVLGGNQLAAVALEAQLVVVRVVRGVEQFRIRLGQKVGKS